MAIEAMTCGSRVIATPIASIKEICGRIAYYAHDFEPRSLFEAILACLRDQTKDKRIIEGSKKASSYSIENAARKTLWVYQEVARQQQEKKGTSTISSSNTAWLAD